MESIIDRVINELVLRLTSSSRSAQPTDTDFDQSQAASAPVPTVQVPQPQVPAQQQEIAVPPVAAPAAQQPQPAPQPMATPQPPIQPTAPAAPVESTEVVVERELQRVVGEARQELDAAVVIVAELRASADGFSERIAATSARLDTFDGWLTSAPTPQAQQQVPAAIAPQAPWAQARTVPPVAAQPVAPEVPIAPEAPVAPPPPPIYQSEANQFATEAAVPQTRTITLTVAALSNLTVVSVVEAALLGIPGVREVALRQLQGRKAILEVRLDEGTALISGLRKALPLAFDVTESSDHSLEITLSYVGAHPQATNGGGGAGATLA